MADGNLASPALIAAGGALIACFINWRALRHTQQKNAELQQENTEKNQRTEKRIEQELQRFQAALNDRQAERDARRDYEYDALRRLYTDCSPILFQLSEHAASAFDRIKGLANTAADGKLDDPAESWLTGSKYRYYLSSTEYRLLAPLACFRLLRDKLTHLDMSLDPEIQTFYVIARQATRVLSEDFALAKDFSVQLAYTPNLSEDDPNGIANPDVARQQGIPRGIVESAMEAMLEKSADGSEQVISFFRFEQICRDKESESCKSLQRLRYFFADFHPRQRPVSWRILLTEALLFRALGKLSTPRAGFQEMPSLEALFSYGPEEVKAFDFRDEASRSRGDTAHEDSLKAALEYIRKHLAPHVAHALSMAKARSASRHEAAKEK